MARTSFYRTLTDRLPQSDVHCVGEHILHPETVDHPAPPPAPEQDWTSRRRVTPAENLLPATERWLAGLPPEIRPAATRDAFPRIANTLALLWARPEQFTGFLDELFIDRRGGRRGFPLPVLQELHALKTYYATLQDPDRSDPGR